MIYTITYGDMERDIESSYADILAYEFSKRFNTEYDPDYLFYTEEQKEFVKNFDTRWLKNDIHDYDYYTTRNFDFLDWLQDKYAEEFASYVCEELDPDEWWDSLDDDMKATIMDSYYVCDL